MTQSTINPNVDEMVRKTAPDFPSPSQEIAIDVHEVCKKPTQCVRLYEWLGRLKIFEIKYAIYKCSPWDPRCTSTLNNSPWDPRK
jgi:hypothetical protein